LPISTLFPYTTLFRSEVDHISLSEFCRWGDLNSAQSSALNRSLDESRFLCPLNELAEIRKPFRVALRDDNTNAVHAKSIREHSRSEEHTSELQSLTNL